MKRVVIRKGWWRNTLRVEAGAIPAVTPDTCLIDVHAAGINFADTIVLKGYYEAANNRYPLTPGFEFAGVIRALGRNVTGFKVGQKVFGFTLFGGCASHLVVSPHQLAPIPKGWSLEACAALPTTTMTALHALHNLAHIQSGHTVLVQSAAGGVGMALCQLARHAGCHVVSVVGNASKIQTALKAGAHTVFVRSPQLWRHVDAAYPNGFDAVLDACGVSTLRPSFERLKPMGNLVVYGFAEVFPRKLPALLPFLAYNYLRIPSFSPWDMTATNRSVHGFNLAFLEQHTDVGIALLQHVATLAQQGHLQPPPLTVFPVDAVAEAYRHVASGNSVGKTILTFAHA